MAVVLANWQMPKRSAATFGCTVHRISKAHIQSSNTMPENSVLPGALEKKRRISSTNSVDDLLVDVSAARVVVSAMEVELVGADSVERKMDDTDHQRHTDATA